MCVRISCMHYILNEQFWLNIYRVISKSVRRELTFLVEYFYCNEIPTLLLTPTRYKTLDKRSITHELLFLLNHFFIHQLQYMYHKVMDNQIYIYEIQSHTNRISVDFRDIYCTFTTTQPPCFFLLLSTKLSTNIRPRKRKPINQVNFYVNCNELSKKSFHCYRIQFILFLVTPVTRCIGHAWLSTNHFKWWLICAKYEVKGLTGSATFLNKWMCWKDIH